MSIKQDPNLSLGDLVIENYDAKLRTKIIGIILKKGSSEYAGFSIISILDIEEFKIYDFVAGAYSKIT